MEKNIAKGKKDKVEKKEIIRMCRHVRRSQRLAPRSCAAAGGIEELPKKLLNSGSGSKVAEDPSLSRLLYCMAM
jgi:hypothetical protein